ncbi:HAD hydrolase family protein [Escherichia coli]|nr:HAD hydrolase family protein [Escherichia coli]
MQHFGKHVEHELGLECEWSWHDQVDIARGGNSKGKRLTKWVEAQGWSMENVVAFGDNFNDISMLKPLVQAWRWATPMTLTKARRIVIGDNTTDSIAQFIYSHLI